MQKLSVKIILLCIAVLLSAGPLTGCSAANSNSDKLKVITMNFPVYDWVKNIAENSPAAEVCLINNNAIDMHSFQPSVKNIADISSCDVFIYIGGESDVWVSDVLKQAKNKEMTVINLLEVLGDAVYTEEIKDGMQVNEEDEALDEHIWLSLNNASLLVSLITEKIIAADKENEDIYSENSEKYLAGLETLERKYAEALKDVANKTLIFADRFPFRYLFEDYGIKYEAAFPGCSSETEASTKTIAYLKEKTEELNAKYLMIIEGSSKKIAETVNGEIKNREMQILTLDSLQSITKNQIESDASYISAMEKNLIALKTALSVQSEAIHE